MLSIIELLICIVTDITLLVFCSINGAIRYSTVHSFHCHKTIIIHGKKKGVFYTQNNGEKMAKIHPL